MTPVIVLNGTSSSGKTSLAKALQQQSPKPMLHASLDAFVDMFDWNTISAADRAECHQTGVDNFHAALPILAAQHYPIVVDHVFERREWYLSCLEALSGHDVCFVGVHCPLATLEQRERDRGDRRIGLARMQFDRVHQWLRYDIEVDTAATTSTPCAERILAFIASRGQQT